MKANILSKQINEMVRIDQVLRFGAVRAKKKSKKAELGIYNYMIYVVDWIHGQKIKEIINKHGYPSGKMLGRKGLHLFWLLVQHQDLDLALQKECIERCSFSPIDAAYLSDRISIGEGKRQIYGTQFSGKSDKSGDPIPQPILDLKNLDKRREIVGLEPFIKYVERFRKSRNK